MPRAFHERAFLVLALGAAVGLLVRARWPEFVEVLVAGGLYAGLLAVAKERAKPRLVLAYAFAFWMYSAVAHLTPALGTPLRDGPLLALDRALLGETPAVSLQRFVHPALTEVLSGCYLTYHLYLHAALLWALVRPAEEVERLARGLFATFAIGFAGYLLLPAVGPAAHLGLPVLEGGPVTTLNATVVKNGASIYDAFPSLHVAVTLALLAHDFRFARRRFFVLLGPCLGLFFSTVYLRYHYVVDLVAGVGVFGLGQLVVRRAKSAVSE